MPKFNIQAVPNYSPAKRRVRDYGYRNVKLERAQRALAQTPGMFTLGMRLILEFPGGKMLHSSTKEALFQYSNERMRWENQNSIAWQCTVDCQVIGLDAHHIGLDQTVVRQLMDLTLVPGTTIAFEVGQIHLGDDVTGLLKIPHEDFVIEEEMEPIDWQQELAKSLKPKRFTRRRKQAP
jgi:hypothetical protein